MVLLGGVPTRRRSPGRVHRMRMPLGARLALLSAALFGVSTPLAKVLLLEIDPWLLAGLLYVAAGVGLSAVQGIRRLVSGPDRAGRPSAGESGRRGCWRPSQPAA